MKELISEYAKRVEKEILEYIPISDCRQKTVFDSVLYSLNAGGKRLRPVIMLLTAEMIGLSDKEIMPFACALEMIHTYSLIHDDLPCMDDDDIRRGKPTNHRVYGEAVAVLAGDALLNMACEVVTSANYNANPTAILKALRALYRASGALGMIGGQIIDIENEGKLIDKDTLFELHLLKTGALIRAAGEIPCIMGGCNKEATDAVVGYCNNLGIAFQIRDDLLDVYGDSVSLGKNIGSDEANDKTTYVTLYGREGSEKLVLEYTNKAKECLSLFGEKATILCELADFLTDRKN